MRKTAIEFILQALKERLCELVDVYTLGGGAANLETGDE
jgi:hypothetical protein